MPVNPDLLVIKPINDIPTVLNPTVGEILYYDGSNELKKTSVQYFLQMVSGIAKPLNISDPNPTVEGWYKPESSGTYANAGGLIAEPGYDTLFYYDGVNWKKTTVDLTIYTQILGDSNTDISFSISQGGSVYLLPIEYVTAATLDVPNDSMIIGIKGKTIINYTNVGTLLNFVNKKNITFKDVIFNGGNSVDWQAPMSASDVKNLVGKGNQNALNITGTLENVAFIDCIFKGFSGWGLFMNQPSSYKLGNNLDLRGSKFINNYMGFVQYERAEYNFHSQIECYHNKIGAWIDGGNNFISTCNITQNSVGLVITGESANNDTHGGVSNSAINHNSSYNLFSFAVNNGFTFNGCHFFDGKIHIENSIGLNIQGGIIDSIIEEVSPRANSRNLISSNIFFNGYGSNDASTFTKIAMNNNYYGNGADPTGLNNSL